MTQEIVLGSDPGEWLVSDWPAGQSGNEQVAFITEWQADNVRQNADGSVSLILEENPPGAGALAAGGEIQQMAAAEIGTWQWDLTVPDLVGGACFAPFLYQEDWRDPRIEFDMEWVRGDATRVMTVVHMDVDTDGDGDLERLVSTHNVDLGFDASDGPHRFELTLDGTSATFLADGRVIDHYDATDMGGFWEGAPVKAYTNLWTYGPGPAWGGVWPGLDEPLVGTIHGAAIREGDVAGPRPILGGAGDDARMGTDGADYIDGRGGSDRLRGDDGDDDLMGGHTDAGQDSLYGGRGSDLLAGGAGSDRLQGGPGADVLYGGDVFYTSTPEPDRPDTHADTFVFRRPGDSVRGAADAVYGFAGGVDLIDVQQLDANHDRSGDQQFRWSDHRAAYSLWTVESGADVLVRADWTGDGVPDLEIRLVEAGRDGIGGIDRGDLLL